MTCIHTVHKIYNIYSYCISILIHCWIEASSIRYVTRQKGSTGRLELILGFRGCRREMDMELAENTIRIALQFLIAFSRDVQALPP